ncbi:MAG: permease, partial [Oxalobacter sp.]
KVSIKALLLLATGGLIYWKIEPTARWLVIDVFNFNAGSALAEALIFFLYDTSKIFLLLTGMVYTLSWLRASLNAERIRDRLIGINRFFGYAAGSVFGAVTPFCSCSSIPLFLGFTTAGIPLGITMSFLITSPIINEVAVVVLWEILGWKLTLIYIFIGMIAGIIGGFLLDMLKAERWLQPFIREAIAKNIRPQIQQNDPARVSFKMRHQFALQELKDILKRTAIWIIVGVGIGAALHGFVPDAWFSENLASGNWWTVPVAVAVGIPLYTNVTGIVPVMASLLAKGLPLGTTLAFTMSTVAASLPEFLMLGQVMRKTLLALFAGILIVLFTLIGWLLNTIQPFIS